MYDIASEEELYVPHPGTLKIGGATRPPKAALCAVRFYERGQVPVDFLFLGGNAGQQAVKACAWAQKLMLSDKGLKVGFVPMRVRVETVDPDTQARMDKVGFIWRMFVVSE